MVLTVRYKLFSVIALFMLAMGCLTAFLLVKLDQSTTQSTAMFEQDLGGMSTIGEIDGLLTRSDINILRMIAIGDPRSIESWEQENEDHLAAIDKALSNLAENAGPEQLASISSLKDAYSRMRAGMMHQMARIKADDIRGAAEINRFQVRANADRVFAILQDLKRNVQDTAERKAHDNLAVVTRVRWLAIGTAAAISLTVLAVGLYVVGTMTAALHKALRVANRIADGRLGNDVAGSTRDETGRLLDALGQMDRQLHRMVYYDPLTSLPNRVLFNERLQQTIAGAESAPDRLHGVMMIDIDRFKGVNDTMGHAIGDELLRQAAARLRAMVRSDDTVSRLGGDEFTVLLPGCRDRSVLEDIARKIIDGFDRHFVLSEREVFVSCSIGIALYPVDSVEPDDLMKYADSAMYLAKRSGRRGFRFYSQELTVDAATRLALESELRYAVKRGELELHYQPKVSFRAHEVIGSEALLRWRRPGGLVPPNKFIPIAEETGLINELGMWVLREACRAAAEWNARCAERHKVAVNLSARQFQCDDLVQMVTRILEETGCRPEWLELEITESVLLEEGETIMNTLSAFKSMGLSIAIDDFGTGYSALSYLTRFPIDVLKIDRSFVQKMTADQRDAELVKAILSIARCLGQQVVAEGVETAEQAVFLADNGCEFAQGFLYSRPLPKPHMTTLPRYLNPSATAG